MRSTRLLLPPLVAVGLLSGSSGCVLRGGGGLFFAVAETAVLAAAIISLTPPPPPRVVFVPEPRDGFAWQPGYWTLHNGTWDWVDGGWVQLEPGYMWQPTHWEHMQDGNWQLIMGRWVVPAEYVPPPPVQAPPPVEAPSPVPDHGVQYVPAPAPPGG